MKGTEKQIKWAEDIINNPVEVMEKHIEWGYQNLEWYISTGRANADFLAAVGNLSDRRMITLIRRAACGSMDGGIAMAKKYLRLA